MKHKRVAVMFALTAVLSLLAAVIPVIKGRPLNLTYLGLCAVFIVIGIATWRKTDNDSGTPRT